MNSEAKAYLQEWMHAHVQQMMQALQAIPPIQYGLPLNILSGSSIGMHVRHILEFFTCLLEGSISGRVCYENRRRERKLEEDSKYAIALYTKLVSTLPQPDKLLAVVHIENGEPGFEAISSYHRELWYVLEHAIHHMALIKIGFSALDIELPAAFGVAPSTIQYRETCAL